MKKYMHKKELVNINNYEPKGKIVVSCDIALNHTALILADVTIDKTTPLLYLTIEDLGYKSSKIEVPSVHEKIGLFYDALSRIIYIARSISKEWDNYPVIVFEEINFQSKGQAAALGEAMLQGVIRSVIHSQGLEYVSMTPAQHYKINTGKSVHFIQYIDDKGKKKRKSRNKEVIMSFVNDCGFVIPDKNLLSSGKKTEPNDDIADALSLLEAYRKSLKFFK